MNYASRRKAIKIKKEVKTLAICLFAMLYLHILQRVSKRLTSVKNISYSLIPSLAIFIPSLAIFVARLAIFIPSLGMSNTYSFSGKLF